MIVAFLLINRQGKTRLCKYYKTFTLKQRQKIIKDIAMLIIGRAHKLCNFIQYGEHKIVFKRYASLYFATLIENDDNELMAMETIHHFVECLDRYFGNVCELDLIYNFYKSYYILDEILLGGYMQESSKKQILKYVSEHEAMYKDNTEEQTEERNY